MIYITQLIYIKAGKEEIFHEFESLVLPLLSKYNAELMLRLRPNSDSIIETTVEQIYELHLVKFASQIDFENYLADEERKKYLSLKEESIRSTLIIKGSEL